MGKFTLSDLMNDASIELAKNDTVEQVSVFDIEPNEDNFYGMRDIEKLKESIILLNGVQENLILVKNPSGSSYKYKALAGHRRTLACKQLTEDGYKEYEFVPAVIKENISSKTEKGILLLTNSTQRGTLTDYEKVMEHVETRNLIKEWKKESGIEGRIRELEAEYLNVSEGQISIYDKIINNLSPELMKHFENGKMGISAAYESARRDAEEQKKIAEYLDHHDSVSEADIKSICGSRIKGQITTDDIPNLKPDNDKKPLAAKQVENNEPEQLITSDENIDDAVHFVFDECKYKTFPEEKMQEIVNCFKECHGQRNGYVRQQLIFDKMLPFENDCVKVSKACGYKVDYIHVNETITIPIYYFWKSFEKVYSWMWEESESENVTESVTFDEPAAVQPTIGNVIESIERSAFEYATGEETENETVEESIEENDIDNIEPEKENVTESVTRLYDLEDVQEYIRQYESDYKLAKTSNLQKTLKRSAILLDALKLLEQSLSE